MRDSIVRSLVWTAAVVAFSYALAPAPALGETAVINITSATVTEGDAGTRTLTFNIICDPCDVVNAIVDWSTMDGSATTADNDYVARSGRIDDLGNGTAVETYPVSVTVNGDTAVEADETFSLKITNASVGCPSLGGPGGCNTPPTAAVGTGTIVNDDSESQPPAEDPEGLPLWLILLILLLLLLLILWFFLKRR